MYNRLWSPHAPPLSSREVQSRSPSGIFFACPRWRLSPVDHFAIVDIAEWGRGLHWKLPLFDGQAGKLRCCWATSVAHFFAVS